MLVLLFRLGEDRYAIDTRQIAEILPRMVTAPIPGFPMELAGVFNYRGTALPVVDLIQLKLKRPALKQLNTRILVAHGSDAAGNPQLLGLIVERATEAMRCDPAIFQACGVRGTEHHPLGPITLDDEGFVQLTDVNQLLPSSVRDLLHRAQAAAS